MQRFRPGLLALGLLCSCLAAQQPAASSAHAADSGGAGLNRLQGMKVSDIQIHSPGSEHAEWLLSLLEQKVNEPLDKYKVRRSVQALYNTGRFYRIDVEEKRDSAGGLILIFAAQGNFFFGSVKIEGAPGPPSENQLANASKLTLGEQFSEAAVRTAIEGMQHVLQDNGYYKAAIQPSYEWDAASQQVKVLFALSPGPRARIGKVTVTGTPDEKPEELMDTIRLDGGDRVSAGSVTSALERLRRRYQKQGRLEAQAVLAKRVYHPENNTLDYTFDITRGPVVEVRVEGDGLSPKLIRKYVPIYEENAVDDDLLNEGRASIRDYLQTQGYFDAKVDYTLKNDSPDHLLVIFSIAKGERHKVLAIDITGNQYFPTATLRERLESQPAGGLLLNGTFSQSIAARDAESIESLYRNNGFLRVKVTPKVEDDYQGQSARLKITMHIEEGPQITIRKLTITGNQALSMDEIRGLISATEGQPYSETAVANDQTQVVSEYFNRGFPNVRLENSAQPSANDPAKVDVTYKITEGQRVYVDKVIISGLNFTRPYVVNREMRLNSGDPLNQNQMLETQRRLYDLGIFNSVDMAIQNPEGEDNHKNISFQVEEARRYTFNYGVGFEVQTGEPAGSTQPKGQPGASARVSFDVTRLNFRGRDHTITLKTRYGNLQKNVLVSYDAPRLFDSEKLTLNFTALYDDTFDVRTFEAKRLEGSGEIRQAVNRGTTLLYRFTYRRVSIPEGSLVIDPNLVPLFSQPVRVSLPSFTFIRDTRDDPINSHKGAFTSIDLGAASGIFGSQASFGRLVAQNSTYYRFHHKRWVFARSTRVGTEEKFGATTFIPLPERFLSGGSNSLRGFGLNQAGPRDLTTGFQLGGEALFVNNLELRTPPLPAPWAGNNLSAVVFHDMGNVFDSPQDAVHSLFRYSQPNRDACLVPAAKNCSFNYVSHAVGSGIRYLTPIGPLGVDVGYNLNPPLFPIAQQNRTDTLAHFNFFFTIGQTF